MGQKVHPVGFRLGYSATWSSLWFAQKDYAKFLHEDIKVRKAVKARFYQAGVSNVEIERAGNQIKVTIATGRPGIIIGRKGAEVDKMKADLEVMTQKQIQINIKEIKRPEMDAQLISENIALQLEKRVAYRRVMKKAVASAMRMGVLGIKVRCAGRLAGSEIARKEWYREGRVPLHTLRAKIAFGLAEAATTMGQIGVKVWIYQGDYIPEKSIGNTKLRSIG
ncbi:MAG: 30S ribosomal protein S3 [Nitrospirota bacterium]